ncbi:MAG: enoyl-CoA hydratase/isomerase family protein [Dehalococcoidia bacterium]
MELQNIVYEKSEGVGAITLNRPGKLNAINFEMLDELWALFQEIVVDDEVHVIVVKGEGRYFCAGADLDIVGTITPETFRVRQRKYWNRVFNEFEDIQKLTIAALNGPALGGGVELALCCDMRYAVDDVTLALPEIDFGILPDSGGTVRLPGLIGLARAKEFILSGDPIPAKKAAEWGLLNGVFPRETFDEEVRKIAVKMARKAPIALGLGKQLINRSFQQRDIKAGLDAAMDVQSILICTEDYREAVKAHEEKRPPAFRGK